MIEPTEQKFTLLPGPNSATPKELQTDPRIGKSVPEIGDEWVHNRTRTEGAQVIIEQYDESGKLLRITPPGYLPYGEVA